MYLLLTNLSTVSTTVTLTYRTAAGAVIGSDVLAIPAYVRGTVWANGTAGAQAFTTEITSTQPIVAERAMYWPTGSSSLQSGEAEASEATAARAALEVGGPEPYTLTAGVLLPPIEGTAETAAVVVGKPVPGSVGAGDAGLQSSSTWHGSHLTLGKRP